MSATNIANQEDAREVSLWPDETDLAAPGTPTMLVFAADKRKASGAAVVICPGGCYSGLAPYEGEDYVLFLSSMDLLLSCPGIILQHGFDIRCCCRMVRGRFACFGQPGAQLNIDPIPIGIMGSSAGGHLASSVMTLYDAPGSRPERQDEIEACGARPDFGILCYPVITA